MSEMVVPRDKYVREGGREAERERERKWTQGLIDLDLMLGCVRDKLCDFGEVIQPLCFSSSSMSDSAVCVRI